MLAQNISVHTMAAQVQCALFRQPQSEAAIHQGNQPTIQPVSQSVSQPLTLPIVYVLLQFNDFCACFNGKLKDCSID